MTTERPTDAQPHYGRHLADPAYWGPFVREVLDRHSLPITVIEAPFPGTFPTFLVGDLVVKLFGQAFDGPRSSGIEVSVHELLSTEPGIRAPAVVAVGALFETAPTWPYVVSERVAGTAIREIRVSRELGAEVATQLGEMVARLHRLTPPAPVRNRQLLPELRRNAPVRAARHGLPDHLVAQVEAFLADAEPATTLVHGDITADHVFVDAHGVTAIIDWGDALVADRAYELPALFLDALRGDAVLLDAFLEAAEWPRELIARRVLQGVLEFQFDAITGVARQVDLASATTLAEVAQWLLHARDASRVVGPGAF